LPQLKEITTKDEIEPEKETGKILEIQEIRTSVMDVKNLCNFQDF
jgi:hypothetical protein